MAVAKLMSLGVSENAITGLILLEDHDCDGFLTFEDYMNLWVHLQ